MKAAILAIIGNKKFRTMIWDTATEVWELCRLAAFGKLSQVMPHHYVEVNSEFRALVNMAYERRDLNAIFIHKVKKEYRTNAAGKDNWTGKWERQGFGDMPYLVDCNLEHFFQRQVQDPEGNVIVQPQFGVRVLDSRHNMLAAVGSEFMGDMCNFEMLGEVLFPDTVRTGLWK